MPVDGARFFEDFEEGESIKTATRTMTEADLVNFCALTGDFNQIHTSAPFARNSHMEGQVFAAQQVFAYAVGLVGRTNIFEGTVKAFVGFDDFSFYTPVHIGDTIRVTATVETTDSSDERFKDDAGLVCLRYDISNTDEKTVGTGEVQLLVFKRPENR